MTVKKILITGASSGLGAGMAREFAKNGRELALCARRLDKLEALKLELNRDFPQSKVHIRALDVTIERDVFNVFEAFQSDMGVIDRIILNSGIGGSLPIGKGGLEHNQKIVTTNFSAFLSQCEAAMQLFYKQGYGHLVGVSSVSAMHGLPANMNVYAATKAGVTHLLEGLQLELANKPFKVTILHPGFIHTEMTDPMVKRGRKVPHLIPLEKAQTLLFEAIEGEVKRAFVPAKPWGVIGRLLKHAPDFVVKKLV